MITPEMIEKRAQDIGDRLVHPTVMGVQQGLSGQQAVMAPSMNYRMLLYATLLPFKAHHDDTFDWTKEQVDRMLTGMAKEELQRELKSNPNIN
jgi:hypothetical protein